MLSNKDFIILGIDPGLVKTGWGCILKKGSSISYINCGVIKTKSTDTMEYRLGFIFDEIKKLIDLYFPTEIAMEEVFVNMNPKTTQKLIMARSAAFISAVKAGYTINEYTANSIKKNITGSGHASKDRVHIMVQKILNAYISKEDKTKTMDSIDALAIAICHGFIKY